MVSETLALQLTLFGGMGVALLIGLLDAYFDVRREGENGDADTA